MKDYVPIQFDLPEKNLRGLEGNYYLKDGRIRLVLPGDGTIPGYITRLEARNKRDNQCCLFFNCKLVEFAEHYDEYQVAEAFLNLASASYDANAFTVCRFELTVNSLPFFNQPWEFDRQNDSRQVQIVRFRSRDDRWPRIQLNDHTTLSIQSGYSQKYSKTRYEVDSSVVFQIAFDVPAKKERAFDIAEAVAAYYSIFCYEPARVKAINLQIDAVNLIYYIGTHVVQRDTESALGSVIIEQSDINGYSDMPLICWVRDYGSYKIPAELLRDALQVRDEELRFICLTRALEVFHKTFYFEKPAPGYLDQLYSFLQSNNLTDIPLKSFLQKVTLSQRLYDLLRLVFELISEQSFRLKVGLLLTKCSMETISYNRNYYTHFTRKAKLVWTSEELNPVNKSLIILLKILFLKQTGFTDDALKRILRKWPNIYE